MVNADIRKFATKDYDLSDPEEVFTIDVNNDGLTVGKPKFYNLVINNLDNGVAMTIMRKIDTTPERRQALGFVNNRLDKRNNISIVSSNNYSVHTLRLKNKLLRRDKLALLRLRQFVQDPQDSSKVVFAKENNIRINIISDKEDTCAQAQTCARLDFIDTTIFKLYPNSCIGGGIAVDFSECNSD
jgi:hypothetical protein